ncbi:MAG: peptide chain release factor 2 [Parcubacteria group bacterium Athens0714_26]|nr:MAG: peptide chain release factor 2 [Parcubacteria group bacterium Athens1014_26]TSD03800.1 MAG: peptide chain release factor 2 [Parcubacteria group bacterium Athens0714_26]
MSSILTFGSNMFKKLTDKYDKNFAHLSVYAGAGGDDAKDWAKMLFLMYFKYAQKRGWKVLITDDMAMEIRGDFAYGFLKKEAGVHRLVRISPFSSKKLRHTSFALIEVVPILPDIENQKIVIPESDLRIDTFRSSGPGGQNVQKLETAVRVVHIPTGVVASCQSERSQLQNKDRALRLLKSKLFNLMMENQKQELSQLRVKVKPEWGSQIRSYVLHPYKLVKDHRTKTESSQPDDVLAGDLDKFIESELGLE